MKKGFVAGALVFVGLLAFAPAASADPPAAPKKANNTEYKFGDDDLLGGTISGLTPIIPTVRWSPRQRLLRPRTQFVQEMLKSVENM
jgi:hypothetical protein